MMIVNNKKENANKKLAKKNRSSRAWMRAWGGHIMRTKLPNPKYHQRQQKTKRLEQEVDGFKGTKQPEKKLRTFKLSANTTIASAAAATADGSTCYCFIATNTVVVFISYLFIAGSLLFSSSPSKMKRNMHEVCKEQKKENQNMKWEFAAKKRKPGNNKPSTCMWVWLTHKQKNNNK